MLFCPQCQFENPDDNKFCQQCGISLTQQTCPECGAQVEFDLQHCQQCGAATGTVWQAIILGESRIDHANPAISDSQALTGSAPIAASSYRDSLQPTLSSELPGEVALSDATVSLSQQELSSWAHLDNQQRYKLLDPLTAKDLSVGEVQAKVLDCQPFQISPLEALLYQIQAEQDTQLLNAEASTLASEQIAPTTAAPNRSDKPLSVAAAIPALAQPYLALRSRFYHTLPVVHDAWQDANKTVVLLEDRSHLPLLLHLWSGQAALPTDTTEEILPLQILHWLHEMTQLWDALKPWQCRQSLLEQSNLRVDEDQILCLQRLYPDPQNVQITLQNLGKTWQELFDQSQRTQIASLALLLRDLQEGEVQTTDQLRSRLEAIAYELQTHFVPPAMNSDFAASSRPDHTQPASPDEIQTSSSPSPSNASPDGVAYRADSYPSTAPTYLESQDAEENPSDGDDTPTVVLPMQLVSLEDAGRTDIGQQREHNEDYFGIHTLIHKKESPQGRTLQAQGLYILCDGMGGHASGEVASALAADTLRYYFQTRWFDNAASSSQFPFSDGQLPGEETIREAVQIANKSIHDINQQNARSGSGRMGTTLVLVLIHGTKAAVAHVGDSRLYCLSRRRGLEQITTDHEVGQREIQRGVEPEIAYARPDAYQLTQALGPRDENFINPDVQFLDLTEDTLLLLCSDGLSDNDLIETHWRTHLEPLLSSQTNLEQGVVQLIDLANQYNGHDNITAIAIRVKVRPNLEQLRQRSAQA